MPTRIKTRVSDGSERWMCSCGENGPWHPDGFLTLAELGRVNHETECEPTIEWRPRSDRRPTDS